MISYTDSADNITSEMLSGFFVGWPNPPSEETHRRLLSKSDEIVVAIDERSDRVVGFITAITDNVLACYIPLLEVLPEYQKQGIGSELVRRMLDKFRDFYMVDLVCSNDKVSFYEKFGLRADTAMTHRDFENQSGR
ncbi:MAG: GNAT family N-acetyltransferase [Candidatus Zixiibacteriota bacterium]